MSDVSKILSKVVASGRPIFKERPPRPPKDTAEGASDQKIIGVTPARIKKSVWKRDTQQRVSAEIPSTRETSTFSPVSGEKAPTLYSTAQRTAIVGANSIRVDSRGRRKVEKQIKVRRNSISLCVSAEEEELLRSFAASQDMGFSAWARTQLFKAMGRRAPERPDPF